MMALARLWLLSKFVAHALHSQRHSVKGAEHPTKSAGPPLRAYADCRASLSPHLHSLEGMH